MDPVITISIDSLCLIILSSSAAGIMGGAFLVRTYVKKRSFKTKSQKELMRLAAWIRVHHPEVIDNDGTVVDKAIQLIAQEEKEQNTSIA